MANAILTELEWDDGLAIPVSNAENKLFEAEVIQLQNENDDFERQIKDNDNHIQNMFQHFKNVEQELTHTVGLQRALSKDLDTEAHMMAIAEREEGRMNQELLRFNKELTELREKRNNMENKIFSDNQQIEELKSQINWDHQALEAWLEESARKDDDAMTLQKYSIEDNSKLKSLTLHIEHMMKESQEKRKILDKEVLETLIAQIELDKTAEDFRETHKQRQQLISLWENTIDLMIKRDKEMDEAANILVCIKDEMMQLERIIIEKESFLQSEIENNAELDRNIKAEERFTARLKNELYNHENVQNQLQNELDTMRYTVARTSTDVDAVRAAVAVLKKEVLHLNDKYRDDRKERRELMKKLEVTQKNALSAEQKAALAAKILAEEEQVIREQMRVNSRTRDFHFKKKQELMKEQAIEKNVAAEIKGGRASSRNLSSRLKKLGRHSIKQQEIIYNQDFTIQQLERRMSRMEGEMNTVERNRLETKISELVGTLEQTQGAKNILNSQLKRLQDDIRRQKRDMETSTIARNKMVVKLQSMELTIETSLKALKKITKRKQATLVDEHVLKLEIQKIQESVHKRAGKVLTLEKRREKLNTALKERKKEIEIHHQILRAQLKFAEEEKSAVNAEVHQRTERICKLKSRFEILTISMAPPDGEEQRSQAFYVIKAAQEKEELQRKGDDLDARISKAEKEMRALENTLKLLNSRNNKMRQTMHKVTETSEEYELQSQLNEQLRSIVDKYKYKRRQIRELQDDMQTLGSAMDAILRDEVELAELMQEKKSQEMQLEHELSEQKEKLERAYKQVFRVAREARQARGHRAELFEEQDIELRNLRSQNRGFLKALFEAIQQHPDVVSATERYFRERNLPLPGIISRSSSSSESSSSQSSARSTPRRFSSRGSSIVKAVDLGLGLETSSPAPRSASESSAPSGSLSTRQPPSRQTR